MKLRILFALIVLALAVTFASAQVSNQSARRLRSGTASPNSPALSCIPGPPYTDIYIRVSDHSQWECTAAPSTWTQVVSGGTPGTVTISGSPASPQLAKFSSGTAITGATATDVSTPVQCSDAGSTDTYACSLAPALASYIVGTHLRFFANTANTGAASINFNSLGVLTIVKVAGGITTDLADNDIRAGQWVEGNIAAGSNFQIQSTLGNAYANAALSNLASVALNTSLLPATQGSVALGSTAKGFLGAYIAADTTAGHRTLLASAASTARTATLPDETGTICTTGSVCAGYAAAGSGIGGSGTLNTIPKFTPDGTHVGNSQITDDGTTVTIAPGGVTNIGGSAISVDTGGGITSFGQEADFNAAVSLGVVNNFAPALAGSVPIGTTLLPFSSTFIGNAANNSAQLTGTFTGNRVATFPDATGTVQLVGAANTGTILPVDMSNGVLSQATGTVYASPGTTAGLTNATESAVSFPVTRAGTIRNLYVRTGGTAKVGAPTTTITIRKNGVDTAVTIAALTQTVTTTSSDTAHSFSVVAGDLITVSFITTGAAAVSTSIAGVSFELD